MSNSEPSGKLGLTFTPSDQWMLFAHVNTGFKGGGLNGNFVINPDALGSYEPETLTAFEAGFKSTLAGGVVLFNTAAFLYDYKDAQIFNNSTDPNFGLPIQRVLNGDADIYGFDADLTWRPSAFLLQAGLGYTHAEYKENPVDRVTGPLPIKGNQMQNTPEWSGTLLAAYEWDFSSGSSLMARVDFSYTSEVFYSVYQDPVVGMEPFTLINARLAWRSPSQKFEIAAWGRNLSDQEVKTYSYDLRLDFGFVQYMRGRPLMLGVDFGFYW